MATSYSPSIVRSGLVLYIDPENERSFPGSPITNYFYLSNPRIDSSYAPYVRTASGTWPQKHPDAITVYDTTGADISDYSNTGVADWTNVYHAIWTYDYTLKKPVVTIRNHDAGTWKAKYFFGASMNFSALGMTVGSQYTISWLQWTDNINRAANVGLYTKDNSNVQSFWDGLSSNSTTTKNTIAGKWQRVYHTYTVSANRNLSDTYTALYMYGYEYGTGTIKISDVQIELFSTPSNFSYNQTRGSTVATGGGFADLSNNSNHGEVMNNARQLISTPKTLVFNGTNNYINGVHNAQLDITGDLTMDGWFKLTGATNDWVRIFGKGDSTNRTYGLWYNYIEGRFLYQRYGSSGNVNMSYYPQPINLNTWYHLSGVSIGSNHYLYLNGALVATASQAGPFYSSTSTYKIGYGEIHTYHLGQVGSYRVYNVGLTAAQVLQNFNATKGRYGL